VNSTCDLAGTPPSNTNQLTILASGWVNLQGGAKLCGHLTVPGVGRMTVVAGTDVEINGNAGGVNFQGLYYARHQIKVGGNASIVGQLVALNVADTSWPVAPISGVVNNPVNQVPMPNSGFMDLSGSATVTYSGGGMGGLAPLNWRECRSDPANPNPFNANDACGALYGGT
jgi:hypothetical protein